MQVWSMAVDLSFRYVDRVYAISLTCQSRRLCWSNMMFRFNRWAFRRWRWKYWRKTLEFSLLGLRNVSIPMILVTQYKTTIEISFKLLRSQHIWLPFFCLCKTSASWSVLRTWSNNITASIISSDHPPCQCTKPFTRNWPWKNWISVQLEKSRHFVIR